ncbi:MAG TPA: hypothetical protein VFN11_20775, partial [Ktedonobacterales bacterium]|nr:hypothetical protein [Ktedonobacterales bacterium]
RKIPAVSSRPAVASQPATNDTKQRTPRGLDSGVKRGNSDRSKSLRKANADLRAEAKRLRRSRIRDAAYAVLDEWYATGQSERLSDKELTRRVQARVDFDVNPSGNTVARWRGPWQSSRAHKAVMEAANLSDVAPMEPQELRELQEVW